MSSEETGVTDVTEVSAAVEFPHIQIILLERDAHRVEHVHDLQQQLTDNGIDSGNIHIVAATDAKTANLEHILQDLEITIAPEFKRVCRRGQIGCILSHVRIMKDFVENNTSFSQVLILEDDAAITPDFKVTVEHVLQAVPSDYDLLYLFVHPSQQKKHDELMKNLPHVPHVLPAIKTWGTVGYIVSKAGATKLLKQCASLDNPIDQIMIAMIEQKKLKAYFSTRVCVNTVGDLTFKQAGEMVSNIWNSEMYQEIFV